MTGIAERVVATRGVQAAQFGSFTNSICPCFCKSVCVVPHALYQAPFDALFAVVASSLCLLWVKGNSLGHFLSPVNNCPKIAVKLDVRAPERLVEKSPRQNSAATDMRRRKSIVLVCSSVGTEDIPYLLGSSLLRMILE